VIAPSFARSLLLSTDLLIEDIHFRRRWTSPYFLGKKSLRVNLSDLAAMGAHPYVALLGLVLPEDCLDHFFEGFLRGFLEECASKDAPLVGGDLSRGEKISISVTVCGTVRNGEPLLRSGATPGDEIFLIGESGFSRSGLDWLERTDPDLSRVETEAKLRELTPSDCIFHRVRMHLLPEIQLGAGQWLQERNAASAMIDVSDGLAADLLHILEESSVSALLYRDHLDSYAMEKAISLDKVLNSGEDYALLFTASPNQTVKIRNHYPRNLPVPLSIGRIIEGDPVILLGAGEKYEPYRPLGYDHFR